ncbi:unnamed protein product, partial [Rangifer tarandus platyrhynchus]
WVRPLLGLHVSSSLTSTSLVVALPGRRGPVGAGRGCAGPASGRRLGSMRCPSSGRRRPEQSCLLSC